MTFEVISNLFFGFLIHFLSRGTSTRIFVAKYGKRGDQVGACSIKLDILVPEGRYFSIGSNLSLNSTAGDEHEDRPDSGGI